MWTACGSENRFSPTRCPLLDSLLCISDFRDITFICGPDPCFSSLDSSISQIVFGGSFFLLHSSKHYCVLMCLSLITTLITVSDSTRTHWPVHLEILMNIFFHPFLYHLCCYQFVHPLCICLSDGLAYRAKNQQCLFIIYPSTQVQ